MNMNDPKLQGLNNQLKDLIDEAKKVERDIDKTNQQAQETLDDYEKAADKSIKGMKQTFSELDQIEKEAGDELDKFILEQSEDLAGE